MHILLRGLPVQPLLDAILPEMWEDITARQKYGMHHGDTECIFLRGPRSFFNFFDVDAQDYPRLPQLIGPLMPVMRPLLCATSSNLVARVMLVRLKAGGNVERHVDTGAYADATERHHVCLSTNPHCHYVSNGEVLQPEPGDAFWFNHHKPHAAQNAGDTDRVHLIVDTYRRLT